MLSVFFLLTMHIVDRRRYGHDLFVCWHETNCNNDWVYATSTVHSSANVSITWDSTTGQAIVDPTINVVVDDATYNIDNCGGIAVYFVSWFSDSLTTWVEDTIL